MPDDPTPEPLDAVTDLLVQVRTLAIRVEMLEGRIASAVTAVAEARAELRAAGDVPPPGIELVARMSDREE